jgi:hypothetical protein
MGLLSDTTTEDLYRLFEEFQVDTVALRKKKISYNELAKLYLELLDAKITSLPNARKYSPIID